ncbi:hypothetical protein CYMTET_16790, partial [Cymbomonas tetramitiformis]
APSGRGQVRLAWHGGGAEARFGPEGALLALGLWDASCMEDTSWRRRRSARWRALDLNLPVELPGPGRRGAACSSGWERGMPRLSLQQANVSLGVDTLKCDELNLDVALAQGFAVNLTSDWRLLLDGSEVMFGVNGAYNHSESSWTVGGDSSGSWEEPFGLTWLSAVNYRLAAAFGSLADGSGASGLQRLEVQSQAEVRLGTSGAALYTELVVQLVENGREYVAALELELESGNVREVVEGIHGGDTANYSVLDEVSVPKFALGISSVPWKGRAAGFWLDCEVVIHEDTEVADAVTALGSAAASALEGTGVFKMVLYVPREESDPQASLAMQVGQLELVAGQVTCQNLDLQICLCSGQEAAARFSLDTEWQVLMPEGQTLGFRVHGNYTTDQGSAAQRWVFGGELAQRWSSPFDLPWVSVESASLHAVLSKEESAVQLSSMSLQCRAAFRFNETSITGEAVVEMFDNLGSYGLAVVLALPEDILMTMAETILPAKSVSVEDMNDVLNLVSYAALEMVSTPQIVLEVASPGLPNSSRLAGVAEGVRLHAPVMVKNGTELAAALRAIGQSGLGDELEDLSWDLEMKFPVSLPTTAAGERRMLQGNASDALQLSSKPTFEVHKYNMSISEDAITCEEVYVLARLVDPPMFALSSVWHFHMDELLMELHVLGGYSHEVWSLDGHVKTMWSLQIGGMQLHAWDMTAQVRLGSVGKAGKDQKFGLQRMTFNTTAHLSWGGGAYTASAQMEAETVNNCKEYTATLELAVNGGVVGLGEGIYPSTTFSDLGVDWTYAPADDMVLANVIMTISNTKYHTPGISIEGLATVLPGTNTAEALESWGPFGASRYVDQVGAVYLKLYLPDINSLSGDVQSGAVQTVPAEAVTPTLTLGLHQIAISDDLDCSHLELLVELTWPPTFTLSSTWRIGLPEQEGDLWFSTEAKLNCSNSCVFTAIGQLSSSNSSSLFGLDWLELRAARLEARISKNGLDNILLGLTLHTRLGREAPYFEADIFGNLQLRSNLKQWGLSIELLAEPGSVRAAVASFADVEEENLRILDGVDPNYLGVFLYSDSYDIGATTTAGRPMEPGFTLMARVQLLDDEESGGVRRLMDSLADGQETAESVYEFRFHVDFWTARRRSLLSAALQQAAGLAPAEGALGSALASGETMSWEETQIATQRRLSFAAPSFSLSLPKIKISDSWSLTDLTLTVDMAFPAELSLSATFPLRLAGQPPLYFFLYGEYGAPSDVYVKGGMQGAWRNAFGLQGLTLGPASLGIQVAPSEGAWGATPQLEAALQLGYVQLNASLYFALENPAYGVIKVGVAQLSFDNLVIFWNQNFAEQVDTQDPAALPEDHSVPEWVLEFFRAFVLEEVATSLSSAYLTAKVPYVENDVVMMREESFNPGFSIACKAQVFGLDFAFQLRTETAAELNLGELLKGVTVPASSLLDRYDMEINEVRALVVASVHNTYVSITEDAQGKVVELSTLLRGAHVTQPLYFTMANLAQGLLADISGDLPRGVAKLLDGVLVEVSEVLFADNYSVPMYQLFEQVSVPIAVPADAKSISLQEIMTVEIPLNLTNQKVNLGVVAGDHEISPGTAFENIAIKIPDLFTSLVMVPAAGFTFRDWGAAVLEDIKQLFFPEESDGLTAALDVGFGADSIDQHGRRQRRRLGESAAFVPQLEEFVVRDLSMLKLAQLEGPFVSLRANWLNRVQEFDFTYNVSSFKRDMEDLVHNAFESLLPDCARDSHCPGDQVCSHSSKGGAKLNMSDEERGGWQCVDACTAQEYYVESIGCFAKLEEGWFCLMDEQCLSGYCPNVLDKIESEVWFSNNPDTGEDAHFCFEPCNCPGPPASLAVSAATEKTMTVTWSPPSATALQSAGGDPPPPVTAYELRYDDGDYLHPWEDESVASTTIAEDAREFTVTGLELDEEYRFRLRAKNEEGWGEFVDWTGAARTCTTLSLAPPQMKSRSVYSIELQWSAPVNDGCGAAAGYRVRYMEACMVFGKPVRATTTCINDWHSAPELYTSTSASIAGLEPDVYYLFEVAAVRDAQGDWSSASEPIETCGAPQAPSPPQATPASASTMRVQWTPEARTTACSVSTRTYQVAWCDMGPLRTFCLEDLSYSPAGLSCHGTGGSAADCIHDVTLNPDSGWYRFKVRAQQGELWGPWSDLGDAVRSPTSPGKPDRPEKVSTGRNHIRIRWSAPADTGGLAITSYRVRYRECDNMWVGYLCGGEDERDGGSYTTTEATISNLDDDTKHDFDVQACNEIGCSDASAWSANIWTD